MRFTTNPTTLFVVNDDILYRLVSLTHGRIRDIALLRGERLSPSSEGWQPLNGLRLIFNELSKQESFSESFETLGARRDHSRQSWLQNAQADIELIKEVWPEVGTVMAELIKRRTADDAGVV
jgi:hypothetical protein